MLCYTFSGISSVISYDNFVQNSSEMTRYIHLIPSKLIVREFSYHSSVKKMNLYWLMPPSRDDL